MVDLVRIHRMLEMAEPKANRIHDVVNEADDIREMPDEALAIAALVYAVSMAKLTKLDLKDFIMLVTITYDRTEFTRKNKDQVN